MIAISASQGQGKTSVLNSLRDLGYFVSTQKTSREILTSWNYTLEEVNSFPKLNANFQTEMLKRHHGNDILHIHNEFIYNEGHVFQERSYADIMAYTMMSMGSYNTYSDYIDDYYEKCKKYQSYYSCVIYLTGREGYIPEADGVRSINKQYAKCVDILIKQYIQEFDIGNVLYINSPDHNERIRLITEHIEKLNGRG